MDAPLSVNPRPASLPSTRGTNFSVRPLCKSRLQIAISPKSFVAYTTVLPSGDRMALSAVPFVDNFVKFTFANGSARGRKLNQSRASAIATSALAAAAYDQLNFERAAGVRC